LGADTEGLTKMPQTNNENVPDEIAFAEVRRSAIDHAVMQTCPGITEEAEQRRFLRDSRYYPYYQLLKEMAEAAQAYAISKQQTAEGFETGILCDAIDVCESVHLAFHIPYFSPETMEQVPQLREQKSRERAGWLWQHVDRLDQRLRLGDVPFSYFDREALLSSVGQYLNLPIRSRTMDRILIDALVAALILARRNPAKREFVDDAEWAKKLIALLKKGFFRMVRTVLFLGGATAAAFYLASIDGYSYSRPAWLRDMSAWFTPET
jgi:hypothetical protein